MSKLLTLHSSDKWLPVSIVPRGLAVEVSVRDAGGFHALTVACRWTGTAWTGMSTRKKLEIAPTHWRRWCADRSRRNLGISRLWIRCGLQSGRS